MRWLLLTLLPRKGDHSSSFFDTGTAAVSSNSTPTTAAATTVTATLSLPLPHDGLLRCDDSPCLFHCRLHSVAYS